MENSNLPTTAISAEALQAGLDYNVNGTQTETSEKSSPAKRRRGGKLEFDPSMGIPLTAMAADLLIARGVPDHRDVPVQASSGATQFSSSSFDGVPPVANGLSALSTLYSPSPAPQNNFRFFRNVSPRKKPFSHFRNVSLTSHREYRRQAWSVRLAVRSRMIIGIEIKNAKLRDGHLPRPAKQPPPEPRHVLATSESRMMLRSPTNILG